MDCLIRLEESLACGGGLDITVYTIVNCGFYEGRQCEQAIGIIKNWCARSGLRWGRGIGIGAGGMLPMVKNIPPGQGPMKNIDRALSLLSMDILASESGENVFVSPNFPRFAYKFGAEMGWGKAARANGLKKKDLSKKPCKIWHNNGDIIKHRLG